MHVRATLLVALIAGGMISSAMAQVSTEVYTSRAAAPADAYDPLASVANRFGSPWNTAPPQAASAQQAGYVVQIVDPTQGMPIGGQECGGCCMQQMQPAPWEHSCSLFADFLYLRPRNAEVDYAVPIDGPIVGPPPASPIQIGRTGVTDFDFNPGFRVGGSFDTNHPSNVRLIWAHFDTETSDSVSTTAPNVIRSLVSHPSSQSAATNFLAARGSQSIGFDVVDLDYRVPLYCSRLYYVNYLVGARYANFDQEFNAVLTNLVTETVRTDISFNGVGLRVGLEGERYSPYRGLKIYGRTAASFMAGEFDASYSQVDSFDPTVVSTSITVGRLVPMLDLEAGVGWVSPRGRWHLSAGYLVSIWLNTVKTSEFIDGVQNNELANLSDALTFDGLVARAEFRF